MSRSQPSAEASVDGGDDLDTLFAELEAKVTPPADTPPADAAADDFVLDLEATEAAGADLRDAPRLSPEQLAREVRVTIRGAADAKAINVSETGVLAETTSRLRPGTVVEVIITFDGVRRLLRATIVRSTVHSLNPTTFRTAFKFEERTTLPERR
ncbi:MAG TPA: hypothetical protein VNN99_07470 [Vicinamibacterales bacterium]|jgi:hypothetical protein|nr:hypothetical protein [Vicinamibacterales bacterium]